MGKVSAVATAVNFLKGKKTYIVMGVMIAYAGVQYWTGAMTADQAFQLAANAAGFGALRGGIAKLPTS